MPPTVILLTTWLAGIRLQENLELCIASLGKDQVQSAFLWDACHLFAAVKAKIHQPQAISIDF